MKATELMIGDWVMNPNDGKRYRVHTVTACEQTRLSNPYNLTDLEYSLGEPIPLTAEILEKNGFERHMDTVYYMDYYHTRNGFTIFNCRTWHECILKSVHELQHALRLCGLQELADDFKV